MGSNLQKSFVKNNSMTTNKSINQLHQILFLRRLIACVLVLKYVKYFYDAVGRLNAVTDTDTGMISYSYSNDGCSACGSSAIDREK